MAQKQIKRVAIVELTFEEPEGGSETPNCDLNGWLTPTGLANYLEEQLDISRRGEGRDWIRHAKVRTIMLENQS